MSEMNDVDRREEVKISESAGVERREHVVQDINAARRQQISRMTGLVWLLFGVLNGLLGIRFILKLLAANPNNAFAQFVYQMTNPFLRVFEGLTNNPSFEGIIVELHALIAIAVYALMAWVVVRLIWLVFYRPTESVVKRYERSRMEKEHHSES